MRDDLWALALVFVPLSLIAVGGGASIIAPMHNQSVTVHQWMTSREFVDIFAIARFSPGPGAILGTLIGFKVASWTGALVATIALFVPSSVLCFFAARTWNRYRGTRVHAALEEGLAPIGSGLILAGGIAVMRAVETGLLGWAIGSVALVWLVWRSSVHPLVVIALGGAVAYVTGHLLGIG